MSLCVGAVARGDARATISTLLQDYAFLIHQLLLASSAISHGMTEKGCPKPNDRSKDYGGLLQQSSRGFDICD